MNDKNLKSYRERYSIRDGHILMYKRTSQGTKYQSDNWYAKFKIPNHKPIPRSLKTSNQEEAEMLAEDLLYDYKIKAKRGVSLTSTKFTSVANAFVKDFAAKVEQYSAFPPHKQKCKPDMLRNIKSITENYLIPYFGKKTLQGITDDDIESYEDWRNTYWVSGKGAKIKAITYIRDKHKVSRPKQKAEQRPPDYSTINKELTVLRKIYKFAKRKRLIEGREILQIENLEKPANHSGKKPGLTGMELKHLVDTMIKRHKTETNPKHARHLLLLMYYVLFMSLTGLRVAEGKKLRLSDCELIKSNGKEYLKIFVSAKGKSRELIGLDESNFILEELKALHKENARIHHWEYRNDLPIFTNQYGKAVSSFAKGLDRAFMDANLLFDSHGKKRAAGAFRKYYITTALTEGEVDYFSLAKQCGTSVAVIEKYYAEIEIKHQPEKVTFKNIFSRDT